ncbi:RDD family protein [Tsuneonella dongtanensis]|uniref:RDD family protein n=1 Tax=Tsuneonella dongtanensis TaxID=692370 RepID=A0A1B2AC10_9SPHN|nr:RDD family protein [Tsuneonella dongtanensis]ANY19700.1 RDD family protein [Tsuneonella dongtanensis]
MTAASARYDAKRRRTVVTPEGIALPFVLATRGARAGALFIDYLILLLGTIAVTTLFAWVAGGLQGLDDGGRKGGAGEFLQIVWMLFWFLAWNGYFLAFELGPRGATPGKRILGIRVAARPEQSGGGGRLTAEAVIARNLLRDIELFLPLVLLLVAPSGEAGSAGIAGLVWLLVFALFPFFNRDSLRAGDLVAGTWVVEAPRTRLAQALSIEGAARGPSAATGATYRFGDADLAVYGEHELQTLERVLRENRPEAIVSVHAAICRKIGWDPGSGDERAFLEAYYAQLRARLEGGMRFGKRKADKFSTG